MINLKKTITVLKNEKGMQVLETLGLAVIGLIAVAVIFGMTRGGFGSSADKIGSTIQAVNSKL